MRAYHGARELAAVVAQASRTELTQLVRKLAGDTLTDRAIAAYTGLDVASVRRAIADGTPQEPP
jgi:hypothetical protein